MRRFLLPLTAGILLALPTAAQAVAFGPDLTTAIPNNPYTCGFVGAGAGCTVQDPMFLDMENVLPDPISHGNQTGVVTDMRVLSAGTARAQFVVVEWSGQPGLSQPFPSGVMAVSDVVTLHPGMNNFNTNLPVDFRLATNGFESWSDIALTLLDATAPIPAQVGGTDATTGLISDNGYPLTQTVADLTAPPHDVAIGGFAQATLLMAGDVTITTGQTPVPPTPPPTPPVTAPKLTLPGTGRFAKGAATVLLRCAAGANGANCAGTLSISSQARRASRKARPVTYGTASFSVPAGAARSVKVSFTRAGRRAIGRRRTLHAYVLATFTGAGAQTAIAPITLRR